MHNDQFFVPHHSSKQIPSLGLQTSDGIFRGLSSPKALNFTYQHIKDLESRIHGYRETALEMQPIKKRRFHSVLKPLSSPINLSSLIEQESHVAGQLFGLHDRLWLDVEGSSVLTNKEMVGDWYHVRELYDAQGNLTNKTLLHFETHPTHIQKIYRGYAVDMTTEELETFITAVMLYEERIREELYPLDQELFDLTN